MRFSDSATVQTSSTASLEAHHIRPASPVPSDVSLDFDFATPYDVSTAARPPGEGPIRSDKQHHGLVTPRTRKRFEIAMIRALRHRPRAKDLRLTLTSNQRRCSTITPDMEISRPRSSMGTPSSGLRWSRRRSSRCGVGRLRRRTLRGRMACGSCPSIIEPRL